VDAQQIPEGIAAGIAECWPDGVIEEFDTDESYFHDIHAKLERDLRKIPGASLLWQTEAEDDSANWDDDDDDEPPPFSPEFQSYHVFFLAPQGSEFEFETETESPEEPVDPDSELVAVTYPGKGWYGCSLVVSLATPFAAVEFADYAEFEDGSNSTPDPGNFAHSVATGEPVDVTASFRKAVGDGAFRKLENLSARIVKALAKHGVVVLDQAILDLPVPDLKSDSEVLLEGKQLTVEDAFFFRGV